MFKALKHQATTTSISVTLTNEPFNSAPPAFRHSPCILPVRLNTKVANTFAADVANGMETRLKTLIKLARHYSMTFAKTRTNCAFNGAFQIACYFRIVIMTTKVKLMLPWGR